MGQLGCQGDALTILRIARDAWTEQQKTGAVLDDAEESAPIDICAGLHRMSTLSMGQSLQVAGVWYKRRDYIVAPLL